MNALVLIAAAIVSLDGLWDFRLEKDRSLEEVALPGFVPNDKMVVPGSWDSTSHYYNQRGTGCYRRSFDLAHDIENGFLVVDGCCLRSRYWIDGREIGFSKLPWSRFEFATGLLKKGPHEIVAAVDSVVDNAKVKLFRNFYDFYAPGGFHHGVWLETQENAVEPRRIVVRTRDFTKGEIEVEVEGVNGQRTLVFDGQSEVKVTFANGKAVVRVPNFKLWSPETPNLHKVSLSASSLLLSARFGIRQVGTADGRITLNGRPVYLKGVNRHELHYEFGATTPLQLMYEDIKNVKDLGGNFIRGSHYAQSDDFLTLCDELGVMVWEESLGWGNGKEQLEDAEFCDLQERQTRLMARNSINHPCIIISGFLNEPDSTLPACKALVDRLIAALRAEDTGHLITFACNRNAKDIAHANTDIIAYNAYPCWYSWELQTGTNREMHDNIRKCHEEIIRYFRGKYKDERPIIVSETGVKADYGARDPRGGAQYTEDFQAEYEKAMLEELFALKDIAGVAIWQFTDAKTYTRTKGLRNRSYGVNTGGLYDLYRRPKLVVEEVRKAFQGTKGECK